ncbi:hypothetical protein ACFWAY_37120 [Rhodococcus sp. NPDC059968]|uniref:hypothetical protein n=1 Tax=Rhodococcus sp. NPDC059968 TaxID=3347017 RepID=UPI00367031BC
MTSLAAGTALLATAEIGDEGQLPVWLTLAIIAVMVIAALALARNNNSHKRGH